MPIVEKTPFYKGHRWTQEQIIAVMGMWQDAGLSPAEIADKVKSTPFAISKLVVRLRKQGIPLQRRRRGLVAGRTNQLWTQAEVEYLIRRRRERATMDEIASELGRTPHAVQAMIQTLRREDVPVPMYGMGVRRLWDANNLRVVFRTLSNSRAVEAEP